MILHCLAKQPIKRCILSDKYMYIHTTYVITSCSEVVIFCYLRRKEYWLFLFWRHTQWSTITSHSIIEEYSYNNKTLSVWQQLIIFSQSSYTTKATENAWLNLWLLNLSEDPGECPRQLKYKEPRSERRGHTEGIQHNSSHWSTWDTQVGTEKLNRAAIRVIKIKFYHLSRWRSPSRLLRFTEGTQV